MKNTVDLDDLLNAPLVINPDDEIKENDVVITEGVVTDDDLLNAPLVIDSNTDEETNIKTDIPEEHEVKEEKEKNIPPSQDTLYSRYKEKYPQLFQNGQLVDFDAAEEIGIISPVSGVATDDEQVTGGHVSTRTKETPFGFMYNTEVESVEVQKENARNNQDFRRIERVAEDFDVPEMSAKEEDKFINDMIDAMPDKNPDGSVNLMKKFLGITGSTGYSIINALGKGVSYVGAGYQDIIEKVAKETQETFPEQYNSIIKKSANNKKFIIYNIYYIISKTLQVNNIINKHKRKYIK